MGKAVLPDDSPFTTGGIGHLEDGASSWAMQNCDTVIILGSTMPWFEYYPKPGQARGVQVDVKADRLGLRYPVEIGLVGDVKATLQALGLFSSASPTAASCRKRNSGWANGIVCWLKSRLRLVRRCDPRWC